MLTVAPLTFRSHCGCASRTGSLNHAHSFICGLWRFGCIVGATRNNPTASSYVDVDFLSLQFDTEFMHRLSMQKENVLFSIGVLRSPITDRKRALEALYHAFSVNRSNVRAKNEAGAVLPENEIYRQAI